MKKTRALDFALYVCIGLAVGGVAILFAKERIDSKWLPISSKAAWFLRS